MFRCDFCHKTTEPGERMFKVPDRATPATGTSGPQIRHEAKLCPRCGKTYRDALKAAAPDINPQSANAALVQ